MCMDLNSQIRTLDGVSYLNLLCFGRLVLVFNHHLAAFDVLWMITCWVCALQLSCRICFNALIKELFAPTDCFGEIFYDLGWWVLLGLLGFNLNPWCRYCLLILVFAVFEERCGDTGPLGGSMLRSLNVSFRWALDYHTIIFEAYVWIGKSR